MSSAAARWADAYAKQSGQVSCKQCGGDVTQADTTPGAASRDLAFDAMARSGRREWKKTDGCYRRSPVERLTCRLGRLPDMAGGPARPVPW